MKTSSSKTNLPQQIQNFLLSYRSTPHATTGCTASKLFLQREVRTRLSLVKPDTARLLAANQSKMKANYDKHAKLRKFSLGQPILARVETCSYPREEITTFVWKSRHVGRKDLEPPCQSHPPG